MVINETKIREALRSDMKSYAETKQFLLEQLDTGEPEKGSRKMNTSITYDGRASGRNGRVIMAGLLAMAAIAVIAVILIKLIPSLRSPAANDPEPATNGSNTLISEKETEDTNITERTDTASEEAKPTDKEEEVQPSIEHEMTGYFYWYLAPAGSQIGMMLYCPEGQAPEDRFLDLLVPEIDQDDGLYVKYADLTGGTKVRAYLSGVGSIQGGEGESYQNGTIVDLEILGQDTQKTEVDAQTLEWMRKVVYGSTQIFDSQEELQKELARKFADMQGNLSNTSQLCLVKSTEAGIMITEADGTVLYSEDTFPGMKAVYKQDLAGNPVYLWQQMQDYGAGSGNAYILDDVMLWKKFEPLALILPDENCSGTRISGDVGFFDIENGSWLMEPVHVNVFHFIGNSLWTDAEPLVQRGTLRRFDGSFVSGEKQPTLVYDRWYYLTDESQTVYDLDGHIILEERDGSAGEQLLDIEDGFYVVRAGDLMDQTLIYDFDRNLLARETSGLVYRGHYGEYLNWIAGGKYDAVMPGVESLVTNKELETILTESEFLKKNPQYAEGLDEPVTADTTRRDYLNISVCGATSDTIEILLEDMGTYRYISCDRNFREIYHNRTITQDPDYTKIRYQKNGFEIRSYMDPDDSGSSGTYASDADDVRGAFAYIPMREATEEELLEFQEQPAYIFESFMLGNTWYRMNNKYFWSEADGVSVFMENIGREWVHAILDHISGIWRTEITVNYVKVQENTGLLTEEEIEVLERLYDQLPEDVLEARGLTEEQIDHWYGPGQSMWYLSEKREIAGKNYDDVWLFTADGQFYGETFIPTEFSVPDIHELKELYESAVNLYGEPSTYEGTSNRLGEALEKEDSFVSDGSWSESWSVGTHTDLNISLLVLKGKMRVTVHYQIHAEQDRLQFD